MRYLIAVLHLSFLLCVPVATPPHEAWYFRRRLPKRYSLVSPLYY